MTIPVSASPTSFWTATAMIAAVVVCSTTGEVLTAAAMKSIGDLDDIRAHSGLKGAIRAVITCPLFFAGVSFLALAFFSLLLALNHLNLSLVAPASASLTLVTNVSEADAGATRLRLRWFSASRREKKASARKLTPAKKSGQVMTARIAPLRPEWARMSSRSPMDFIAAAVRTSPVVEQTTTAAIMAVAVQKLVGEAETGIVIVPAPLAPPAQQERRAVRARTRVFP